MRARGANPLDHGTLYVARFNEDGSGDWPELSLNVPDLASAFPDPVALLVNTRAAADIVCDPDGLWSDREGRLFIQTDGGQKDGLSNQMLVSDPETGAIRRLFTGVTGREITGIAVTRNRRTMFVNVQHPGDGDPTLTNFPAMQDGVTIPRDATIVSTRKDGGIVGT